MSMKYGIMKIGKLGVGYAESETGYRFMRIQDIASYEAGDFKMHPPVEEMSKLVGREHVYITHKGQEGYKFYYVDLYGLVKYLRTLETEKARELLSALGA
jgi:hypothetical protein